MTSPGWSVEATCEIARGGKWNDNTVSTLMLHCFSPKYITHSEEKLVKNLVRDSTYF